MFITTRAQDLPRPTSQHAPTRPRPCRSIWLTALVIALYLTGTSTPALAQVSVTTGIDYAEGRYGTPVKTRQWSQPLSVKYEADDWFAKLTIPYVWIENVNPNAQGEDLPCGNASRTARNVEGFGDTVATGSYSIYADREWLVDVGGKVKIATGDRDKCLSTGKNDYSLQTDITRKQGRFSLFGTLGWTKKGDPSYGGESIDYRNPFYFSLGAGYRFTPGSFLGASYDYRQALTGTGDPVSELTLFHVYRHSGTLKLQTYLSTGFTDNSPDLGLGVLAVISF